MPVTPSASALRAGHGGRQASRARSGWVWLAVPAGFLAGSIPVSYVVARHLTGVDLRRVGNGTVSGTALYQVAGFGPLAAAGILEVAKGAVGPALAGRRHPIVAAGATAASIVGHNWSPWLRGAGGRGISPALGALAVAAPAAAATLLAGMVGGRLAGQTAVGSLLADALAVPAARRAHGQAAGWAAGAAIAPMLVKRVVGNRPADPRRASTYVWRLLFDRDTRLPGPVAQRLVARTGR
ncbi:MAG: glycerol-3-phosphate acyltransferase [Acidimicrobiaceae bacterium]|nr:glycerol-3-phosphate acyltransferase [Acidimicrobiaceae bacterium]